MLIPCRHFFASLVLPGWAATMSYLSVTLMIGHWVPLPKPAVGSELPCTIEAISTKTGNWAALHILYTECRCSQRILEHLLHRKPLAQIDEFIVLVGNADAESPLEHGPFPLLRITPAELKTQFNVEAAPLLIVLDPDKLIRYSGAYTARKQGVHIQDVGLITRTVAGEKLPALPVFGCGVSNELKHQTDPFGFKESFLK